MPQVPRTYEQGVLTIGPLANATDFQVLSGSCRVSTEDPGVTVDFGFKRTDSDFSNCWHVIAGKTVYIRPITNCVIYYGELG